MRLLTIFFVSCILFCSSSIGQDFKKQKDSEVDSKKVQMTQKFANDFLVNLKNGSYYQFQNEAIDILKTQLNEQNQKLVYKDVKSKFGDYQSMSFSESWIMNNSQPLTIYRFKGSFEKSTKKLEIRVVLNELGKIAGFFILPWSDMLK